jgi:hypothetical protein
MRLLFAITCLVACYSAGSGPDPRPPIESTSTVNAAPDISGLAWLESDTFLAVHDAKNPMENDRPRVSLLRLPRSVEGLTWQPLSVAWPSPLGPSSDLESIARIPGTDTFLLLESGEPRVDGPRFRRAFLVELRNNEAVLLSFAELPQATVNIEGSAVAKIGNMLVFLCAERGDDRPGTEIYWAELHLQPLRFGTFHRRYFTPVGFVGPKRRPVSAIEIDRRGTIYVASAYDPDNDDGPFSSVIWRVGNLRAGANKRIVLSLPARPQKLATLDGLKVESLAIRETRLGTIELFAGTDDENYGGTVRRIPINQ